MIYIWKVKVFSGPDPFAVAQMFNEWAKDTHVPRVPVCVEVSQEFIIMAAYKEYPA